MKIILDGMGGDHAPDAIVEGAVQAAGMLKDADEIWASRTHKTPAYTNYKKD